MDYETIKQVKEELKTLALYQRKNKRMYRKAESLAARLKNVERVKKPQEGIKEAIDMNDKAIDALSKKFNIALSPWDARARITALLNFYHEIRGSEYRHNTSRIHPWTYERAVEAVRVKYVKTTAVA